MALSTDVLAALQKDRVIDITTTGRNSGKTKRIETWYHRVGDRYFLTGTPGKRDWYANLAANPDFTFHLKNSAQADLPATASPITEDSERRVVLSSILAGIDRPETELDVWVSGAPLVEVTFKSV